MQSADNSCPATRFVSSTGCLAGALVLALVFANPGYTSAYSAGTTSDTNPGQLPSISLYQPTGVQNGDVTFSYEIDDIDRFPRVGNFVSYCRLVKPAHESAGKKQGAKNLGDRKRLSQVGL